MGVEIKMFIIRIGGGLGNQLYQYAFAIVLGEIYPSVPIAFDISSYRLMNEHDGFEIPNLFRGEYEIINDQMLKIFSPFHALILHFGGTKVTNNKIEKYILVWKLDKLYRIIQDKRKVFCRVTDGHLGNLNGRALQLEKPNAKDYYFEGAWQNIGYFLGYESLIKERLRLQYDVADKNLLKRIQATNSIGIHVRGRDFCKNKSLDLCDRKYYRNAIDRVIQLCKESPDIYIFTDDEEKTNKLIDDVYLKKAKVICGNSYDDFVLLMSCKYKIISNSTFSFWAAYLSEREEAITIAPMFSAREKNKMIENSVPKNWIVIRNNS